MLNVLVWGMGSISSEMSISSTDRRSGTFGPLYRVVPLLLDVAPAAGATCRSAACEVAVPFGLLSASVHAEEKFARLVGSFGDQGGAQRLGGSIL